MTLWLTKQVHHVIGCSKLTTLLIAIHRFHLLFLSDQFLILQSLLLQQFSPNRGALRYSGPLWGFLLPEKNPDDENQFWSFFKSGTWFKSIWKRDMFSTFVGYQRRLKSCRQPRIVRNNSFLNVFHLAKRKVAMDGPELYFSKISIQQDRTTFSGSRALKSISFATQRRLSPFDRTKCYAGPL